MKDFDDSVLRQILEVLDTCLLTAQCRILEGQITRDELEQELLQVRFVKDDFYDEEYRDDIVDYNVPPQEEEECYMKKINWEQMLPPQVLPKDSYDKNSHIKDVLIEFMNINQGSIDKFESQCERLSEQIVEFEKMNEKLEIEDDLIDVKKKDEEEELIKVEDDLVWKETQKSQFLRSEYVEQEISPHKNIPQIFFSNKRTIYCYREMKVIEQLKRHLMRAQQVMKNQADNKRKDGIFNVGDIVLVKLQPYWQHSVELRKNKKLSTRQFGPLTVIEKIGNLAYKLKLLATAKIHPVFHISQLKEFKSSNEEPYFRLPLTTSETGPML
ncbi:unnamed protein product [Trifolium pratense]|uniref:Uncharacterized protein n=1 Tax=Trifolium pratense TaxID=57577 RepID=A0ACB0J9L1_TRIPR|nr:unnamed protein product [Trifolium pratense]